MSVYTYIRDAWKQPKENLGDVWRERLQRWRREDAIVTAERPTRLDKARSLGYKAKNGISVARGRVKRGGRKRERPTGGRRPKRAGQNRFTPDKSHQRIVEERISRKFPNMEVLNSYPVAKDADHKWFEAILVDPDHPEIENDEDLNWICGPEHRGRAERGKTSAGKKGRGLRNRGTGAEKARPSKRANNNTEN